MNEWVSVKDSTPDDGKKILFTDGHKIVTGFYSKHKKDWFIDYYGSRSIGVIITHWMNLPKLPEVDNG